MNYFISDTHFGHENILKYERSEFENIQQHDNLLFNNLKHLTADDTLYHLGDFVFKDTKEFWDRWDELPFRKVIIKGNHDRYFEKMAVHFDESYWYPIYFNSKILLSHYPMPVTPGILNVHGHIHGCNRDNTVLRKNYFNISAKEVGYMPVKEETILELQKNLPQDCWRFRKEWYAVSE